MKNWVWTEYFIELKYITSALWESLACHHAIWTSLLYHFLDDLKGNVLTGVTFDPFCHTEMQLYSNWKFNQPDIHSYHQIVVKMVQNGSIDLMVWYSGVKLHSAWGGWIPDRAQWGPPYLNTIRHNQDYFTRFWLIFSLV